MLVVIMNKLNTKKALSAISNMPFLMAFVVAIGVATAFLTWTGYEAVEEASIIPNDLEDIIILIPRFYNSPDCFAYVDDVGRVHPGIIDPDKFTKDILNEKCFPPSYVNYAFRMSLKEDFENGPKIIDFDSIETFNWDQSKLVDKEIAQNVPFFFNDRLYDGILTIKIKDVE